MRIDKICVFYTLETGPLNTTHLNIPIIYRSFLHKFDKIHQIHKFFESLKLGPIS